MPAERHQKWNVIRLFHGILRVSDAGLGTRKLEFVELVSGSKLQALQQMIAVYNNMQRAEFLRISRILHDSINFAQKTEDFAY